MPWKEAHAIMNRKPIELDYLPTRNGGEDQIHNHTTFKPSDDTRESCGACAQLANDFAWLRYHDAIAGTEGNYGTLEDAMAYAVVNAEGKADLRLREVA